jgi:hypothetical protein
MLEAVQRLKDPSFRPETIRSIGRLYTLPNLGQWFAFHARVGWRVLSSQRRAPTAAAHNGLKETRKLAFVSHGVIFIDDKFPRVRAEGGAGAEDASPRGSGVRVVE